MKRNFFISKIIDGIKYVLSVFNSDVNAIDTSAEMSSEDRITALSKATGSSKEEIAEYEAAFNKAAANLQISASNTGLGDIVIPNFNDAEIARNYRNQSSKNQSKEGTRTDDGLYKE